MKIYVSAETDSDEQGKQVRAELIGLAKLRVIDPKKSLMNGDLLTANFRKSLRS
jgi:hypothetical protein